MRYTVSPYAKPQFFDNSGEPAVGYKLFVYQSGTTTKLDSYSDSTGTPNTNPIVLDSAGRASIYLGPNLAKFVLATPVDTDPPTSPVWTVDPVTPIPDTMAEDMLGTAGEDLAPGNCIYLSQGDGSRTAGRWYKTDNANLYSSSQAGVIGFAQATIVTATSGAIRIEGKVTDLTGLTAGSDYFVSSTPGAITATDPAIAGGHSRIVGVAETTTSLITSAWAGTRDASLAFSGVQSRELVFQPTSLLQGFGYASGQANAAGSGDTDLTSYTVTIPAYYLPQEGDTVVIEGTFAVTATETVVAKIQVASGTKVTIVSDATAAVNDIIPFRIAITRRSQTSGGLTGLAWQGVASGGAPAARLINGNVGTVDWGVAQFLHIYAVAATSGTLRLTDYRVVGQRGFNGLSV